MTLQEPPPAPPPAKPPLIRRPSPKTTEFLVVLAFAYMPSLIGSVLSLYVSSDSPAPPTVMYLETAAHLAGTSIVLLYLVHINGGSARDLGLVRPRWLDVPAALFILFLGWMAAVLASTVILSMKPEALAETQRLLKSALPHSKSAADYLFMVVGCIAIGFTEELVFRGYIITRWRELSGSSAQAIAVSTLLFGLYHAYQGIDGVVGTATLGLVFAVAFNYSRRLWPLMLAHTLVDIVSLSQH